MIHDLFIAFLIIVACFLWFLVGCRVGRDAFIQELVDSGEAEWNKDKTAIRIKK
jgi:hypothetical protein